MDHILRCFGDIYEIDIVKSAGCLIFDAKGNQYVDFEAGVWCTALGHGHPEVNQVMHQQVDTAMHLGYRYQNRVVEEAAQAVLAVNNMPEGKVVFLSSGSEAVEFGAQAARRLNKKPLLLALKGTYLAAFGSAGKRAAEEWSDFDWSHCQDCKEHCDTGCPLIKAIPIKDIGGMIFESGSATVKTPPRKVVKTLASMVKDNGGLLVANEITTGFGRTGSWFGYNNYELSPDIVAMGKGMGNGYPVSAIAFSKVVAQGLEDSGLRYAQSHQNDPLGCAVALSVIGTLQRDGLVERAVEVGTRFKQKLEALASRQELIKEVRGQGLMLVMEFSSELSKTRAAHLHEFLFRAGFLVGYSPVPHFFRFFPALIIEEKHMDDMIVALEGLVAAEA